LPSSTSPKASLQQFCPYLNGSWRPSTVIRLVNLNGC